MILYLYLGDLDHCLIPMKSVMIPLWLNINDIRELVVKGFIFICFSILFAANLWATPSLQTSFVAFYPDIRETQLDSCTTCHMPVVKDFLNEYGLKLREKKIDFDAVKDYDSDKDGVSNGDEISNGTFPGSHAEYPEYYVFKNTKGDVHFNHEMHVSEESYLSEGKCKNCHGKDLFPKKFDDNVAQRTNAHRICWKCHKTSGSENAPKKCAGCHE